MKKFLTVSVLMFFSFSFGITCKAAPIVVMGTAVGFLGHLFCPGNTPTCFVATGSENGDVGTVYFDPPIDFTIVRLTYLGNPIYEGQSATEWEIITE